MSATKTYLFLTLALFCSAYLTLVSSDDTTTVASQVLKCYECLHTDEKCNANSMADVHTVECNEAYISAKKTFAADVVAGGAAAGGKKRNARRSARSIDRLQDEEPAADAPAGDAPAGDGAETGPKEFNCYSVNVSYTKDGKTEFGVERGCKATGKMDDCVLPTGADNVTSCVACKTELCNGNSAASAVYAHLTFVLSLSAMAVAEVLFRIKG